MTRLEAIEEVLKDPNRCESDRTKAIEILREIASNSADREERQAALKLMPDLPMTQDDEDAKIAAVLDYYDAPSDGGRHSRSSAPHHHYGPNLKALCDFLSIHACMFLISPEEGSEMVSQLKSLYGRTKSQRIRDRALFCLWQVAAYSTFGKARDAARAVLVGLGLNRPEDFEPFNVYVTSLQKLADAGNENVIPRLAEARATGKIPEAVRKSTWPWTVNEGAQDGLKN